MYELLVGPYMDLISACSQLRIFSWSKQNIQEQQPPISRTAKTGKAPKAQALPGFCRIKSGGGLVCKKLAMAALISIQIIGSCGYSIFSFFFRLTRKKIIDGYEQKARPTQGPTIDLYFPYFLPTVQFFQYVILNSISPNINEKRVT